MPYYRVPVTRDVTETAYITVEAETPEDAQRAALDHAQQSTAPVAYELDDCTGGEPYIADLDDLPEEVDPPTMGEADGIRALQALLESIATARASWATRQAAEGADNETSDQEEADSVVETLDAILAAAPAAGRFVNQLADDLLDRTDVDVRDGSRQPVDRTNMTNPGWVATMRLVVAAEDMLNAFGGNVPDWMRSEAAELGKALEPFADGVTQAATPERVETAPVMVPVRFDNLTSPAAIIVSKMDRVLHESRGGQECDVRAMDGRIDELLHAVRDLAAMVDAIACGKAAL